MYIEVLHDNSGNIKACYCADTLPMEPSAPILSFTGVPQELNHARLNIDTMTAMDIENGSRPRAIIDEATGQPKIEEVDRARFVMENYEVDPSGSAVVGGVTVACARRKA